MSLILVAHVSDKSYVFPEVDAETQWNEEWAKKEIEAGDKKFKWHRADALLLAHNMQNRMKTSNGVREMFLEERPKRKRARTDKQ
jgi:hypothetical protein